MTWTSQITLSKRKIPSTARVKQSGVKHKPDKIWTGFTSPSVNQMSQRQPPSRNTRHLQVMVLEAFQADTREPQEPLGRPTAACKKLISMIKAYCFCLPIRKKMMMGSPRLGITSLFPFRPGRYQNYQATVTRDHHDHGSLLQGVSQADYRIIRRRALLHLTPISPFLALSVNGFRHLLLG
jgi:hypothetical protein